jgi:lysozyme family protein
MSKFGPAFNLVIDHEDSQRLGTITHDEGHITKWGISSRAFPDVDIAALTLKDALTIYHDRIWEPGGFERLESQAVANHVFDRAVNVGTRKAVELLQTALNATGDHLTVDGVLGEVTAAAANAGPGGMLLPALMREAVMFYGRLVVTDPRRLPELLSWLDRATAA